MFSPGRLGLYTVYVNILQASEGGTKRAQQKQQGRQERGEDGQGQGSDEGSRRCPNRRQEQEEGRPLGPEEGQGQGEEGRPQRPTLLTEGLMSEGAGAITSFGPSSSSFSLFTQVPRETVRKGVRATLRAWIWPV